MRKQARLSPHRRWSSLFSPHKNLQPLKPKRTVISVLGMLCAFLLAMPAWGQTPTVEFASARFETTEGSPLHFRVTLSTAPTGTVTVAYTIAHGSTTAADYTGLTGTTGSAVLTGDGTATAFTITLSTADDSASEGIEYTSMTLTTPTGATLGTRTVADGIIVDDATDNGNLPTKLVFRQGGEIVTSLTGVRGQPFTYTVNLGEKPLDWEGNTGAAGVSVVENEATVTLSSDDFARFSNGTLVSPRNLLFDAGEVYETVFDWYKTKTVTVTTTENTPTAFNITHRDDIDDDSAFTDANNYGSDHDGTGNYSISLSVALTVSDEDSAVSVSTRALTATLEGDDITYEVVLSGSAPSQDVTVTPSKGSVPDTELSLNPSQLVFTSMNFSTAQTVTVSAYAAQLNGAVTISHTVSDSATYGDVPSVVVTPESYPILSVGVGIDDIVVSDVRASEGDGMIVFEIRITTPFNRPQGKDLIELWGLVVEDDTTRFGAGDFIDSDLDANASHVTITVPNGATAVMATLLLEDDQADEMDETFTFRVAMNETMAASFGSTFSLDNYHTTARGTVTDDDPVPTLCLLAPSGAGGGEESSTCPDDVQSTLVVSEDVGEVVFTVAQSASSSWAMTVQYATANGTAVAGTGGDYTGMSDTLTFPIPPRDDDALLMLDITVPIIDDDIAEEMESFTIALSNPNAQARLHGSGTSQSITVTIQDDDGFRLLATRPDYSPEANAIELDADGSSNYTLRLSQQPNATVTVALTSSNPGAVTVVPPSMTFTTSTWNAPQTATVRAQTGASNMRVAINHAASGDARFADLAEQVVVGTAPQVLPVLTIADATANERDGVIVFTASLSAAGLVPATVRYFTENGAAGRNASDDVAADHLAPVDFRLNGGGDDDYMEVAETAPGVISFGTGTTALITVTLRDGTSREDDEYFKLILHNPANATFDTGDVMSREVNGASGVDIISATGTIADDDPKPTLSIDTTGPVTVTEGDTLLFTIRWNASSSLPMTVDLEATAGTATADDFGQATGFIPGKSHTGTFDPAATPVTEENHTPDDVTPITELRLDATAQNLTIADHAIHEESVAGLFLVVAWPIPDDDALETDETFTISLASPNDNAQVDANADSIEVTIEDDDVAVIASPSQVVMVLPSDGSDPEDAHYEVSMMGPVPEADVTITPSAAPDDVVTFTTPDGGDALVFARDDHETAQTVTVSATAASAEADDTVTVTHALSGSAGYVDATVMPVTIVFRAAAASAEVTGIAVTSMPSAGSDTYGSGETITIRVSFSLPVRVTGSPQLKLRVNGEDRLADLVGTPTGPVSELTFEYAVQPGDNDTDGIETAADDVWQFGQGDAIVDGASGDAVVVPDAQKALLLANAKVNTPEQPATAQVTGVTVASTSEAGTDTYAAGETIELRVSFSSPVRITGSPQLRLRVGGQSRLADLAEIPTGPVSTLLFEYTVQAGDTDADGIETGDDLWELGAGDAINDDTSGNAVLVPDAHNEFTLAGAKVAAQSVLADAGNDQDIDEEATVTLDGSGSSTSGGVAIASYQWRADADNGIDVMLTDADQAVATFTAPNLLAPVELTFELTVTGDDGETDADEVVVQVDADNDPPTALASANPATVDEGATVTLTGTGSDPENQAITFAWSMEDAADQVISLDGDEATTTFTAPTGLARDAVLTFKLEVSDGVNKASDAVQVTVRAARSVQAAAGEDQDDIDEEDAVTLDGSGSSASGGAEIASYQWRADGDNEVEVTLANADQAAATFTVPNLLAPVTLTFELTVTGDGGETDTDEVTVQIDADNDPPTATASANPTTVNEGDIVTLTGTGSDPEGQPLSYAWAVMDAGEQEFDIADEDSARTTFTAPTSLEQDLTLTFVLTVSDPENDTTATVTVTVRAADLSEIFGESLSRMGRMMAASARDAVGTRLSLGAASAARSGGLTLNGNPIDAAVGFWPGKELGNWLPLFAAGDPDGTGADHSRRGGTPSRNGAGGMSGMAGGTCGVGGTYPTFADCGHFTERTLATKTLRLPSLTPWDDLPNITSFEYAHGFGIPSPGMPSGLLSNVSLWGEFDTRTFESEATDSLTLEGSMTAFYVGIDKLYNGRDVAGIALGLPSNTVDFTDGEVSGEITLSMVNFLPYASWSPDNGRFNVWGMLGFGSGESEVAAKSREAQAADTSMTLFAGGGSMPLATVYAPVLGDLHVTAKADAFSVSMSSDETTALAEQSVSASQLRGVLETRILYAMSDTALLEPLLELGLRFDGGDGDTGMGMEMGLGAAFTNTTMGFSADGRARFLVFHGGDGVAESGFSLLLLYDPGGAGGPGLSLAPVWGETASQSDALWHAQDITGLALRYGQGNDGPSGNDKPRRDWHPDRMDLSLHYGFERTRWMVTPYGALVTSNGSRQHTRLGLRLEALRLQPGTARLNLFNEQAKGPGLEASLHMPLH